MLKGFIFDKCGMVIILLYSECVYRYSTEILYKKIQTVHMYLNLRT